MSIVSVCLTPGIQRSVALDSLNVGEVNRLKAAHVDVSGKGINVCRVLQRLKIPACCLSQGGSNADELMLLAQREGLNLKLVASTGMLRTCTSIIETSATGGCRVTELIEPSPTVEEPCIQEITRTVKGQLPTAQALVIAGSMAPGFPSDYQAKLAALARARAAGVRTPVIAVIDGEVEARVRALEAGADDCLSWPIVTDELEARIRAVQRRAAPAVHRPPSARVAPPAKAASPARALR